MALSYWGWEGDQIPIAAFVKPNPRDKNVMPYELEAFVSLRLILRWSSATAGRLSWLSASWPAGYPFHGREGVRLPGRGQGMDGHYQLLVGYDDEQQRFTPTIHTPAAPTCPFL